MKPGRVKVRRNPEQVSLTILTGDRVVNVPDLHSTYERQGFAHVSTEIKGRKTVFKYTVKNDRLMS